MSWCKRLLGLAVLPMIVGLGVFIATEARATTGGCLVPTDAVSEFTEDFFDAIFFEWGDLSENESTCKKQCNDYRDGCMQVAKKSDQCFKAAWKSIFDGVSRECKDLSDKSDRKSCSKSFKAIEDEGLEELKEDKSLARAFCKDEHDDCRDACSLSK
jgi:hypothetical protein